MYDKMPIYYFCCCESYQFHLWSTNRKSCAASADVQTFVRFFFLFIYFAPVYCLHSLTRLEKKSTKNLFCRLIGIFFLCCSRCSWIPLLESASNAADSLGTWNSPVQNELAPLSRGGRNTKQSLASRSEERTFFSCSTQPTTDLIMSMREASEMKRKWRTASAHTENTRWGNRPRENMKCTRGCTRKHTRRNMPPVFQIVRWWNGKEPQCCIALNTATTSGFMLAAPPSHPEVAS